MNHYLHGYSQRETQRLQEQSEILEELLHSDTTYAGGGKVLEAGCGVGGQTIILARRNIEAEFTSVDISEGSLQSAVTLIAGHGITNVDFQNADIMRLPFDEESFDHVFICFVLEHLSQPVEALVEVKRVLKTGGSLTAIEGDHGSCFWYPQTSNSLYVWNCLIKAQQDLGHDPLIGRRLSPLLHQSGLQVQSVDPRWVYADRFNPGLRDGMVNKIIVPMTRTARDHSIEMGLINPQTWESGIYDLEKVSASPEGTFFYTWFKGLAIK